MITLNATYQQTKRLVDPVEGTYQTVLTIDPSVVQSDILVTYNCTVENARGRSSRMLVVGELTLYTCCCYLQYIDIMRATLTPFFEPSHAVQLIRPSIGRNTFYILMSDIGLTSKAY